MITGTTNTKNNFPNTGPSLVHNVPREGSFGTRFAIHAGMSGLYLLRLFNIESIVDVGHDLVAEVEVVAGDDRLTPGNGELHELGGARRLGGRFSWCGAGGGSLYRPGPSEGRNRR